MRTSAEARLGIAGASLSRTDPAELGLPQRAVDAIFRKLQVGVFDGYSRPLIRVRDYWELVQQSTYRDDRVRPCCDLPTGRSRSYDWGVLCGRSLLLSTFDLPSGLNARRLPRCISRSMVFGCSHTIFAASVFVRYDES